MKIATWNINSVRARLANVTGWLAEQQPDILLLQEIKCENDAFPALEIQAAGYAHCAIVGQKSYNGVAILSKQPLDVRTQSLYAQDPQARYVEAAHGDIIVASLYLPNGNPLGGEKYAYKKTWLMELEARAEALLKTRRPVVLGGDFNIIPGPVDAAFPEAWKNDALFQDDVRKAYVRLLNMGWTDAWRSLHPLPARGYTFWDYTNNSFTRDDGIRIDHMLLSPEMADRLLTAEVDRGARAQEKSSDHTPLIATYA